MLPGAGASDYERYLRTDELLALQKTAEEWVHRDELLFQTVHQTSELWLKLATTEVDEAAACSRAGSSRRRCGCCAARCCRLAVRHDLARDARADVAVGVPADPRRARPRQRLRLARLPRGRGRDAARRPAFTACSGAPASTWSSSTSAGASSRSSTSSPSRSPTGTSGSGSGASATTRSSRAASARTPSARRARRSQVLGKLIAQRQLPSCGRREPARRALRRRAQLERGGDRPGSRCASVRAMISVTTPVFASAYCCMYFQSRAASSRLVRRYSSRSASLARSQSRNRTIRSVSVQPGENTWMLTRPSGVQKKRCSNHSGSRNRNT